MCPANGDQGKIVQVDDFSYPFWTLFGDNRTEDSGEDSGSQGEAAGRMGGNGTR